MDKNIRSSIIYTGTLSAIIFIFLLLIPQIVALGKGAIAVEEFQTKFFSYSIWGIGFFIGIALLFAVELAITNKDGLYGNSLAFDSPGEVPGLQSPYFKNRWKLVILSIIIFSLAGLFVGFRGQSFTGIGSLEQQFTPTDDLIFRSSIVPTAENLGAAFVLALTIFFLRYLGRKYNWNKNTFMTFSILGGSIIVMIYGLINHLFRYSNSDIALFNVGGFWLIGGLISVMSGSFIPFWVLHFMNNFFIDMRGIYSSDILLIMTLIAIGSLGGYYYYLFGRKK